jgi:hypothetical protein
MSDNGLLSTVIVALTIQSGCMELEITKSPHPAIVVSAYDPNRFPKFDVIFDPSESDPPLRFLKLPQKKAHTAVVIENVADRDVTALRYRWLMTGVDGKVRTHTVSSDSYYTQYQPVLKRGDRKLVSGSLAVDESLIDHLLKGGGAVGGGIGMGGGDREEMLRALRFEIDTLVFEDGELAGEDTAKYAAELQCRKRSAEFVVRQIHLAKAEGRDVAPVLSALREAPYLRDDFLADWTQQFASQLLSSMTHTQMWDARMRHLQNLPTLPRFYRPDMP